MRTSRVVLAGGSGFLGQSLRDDLVTQGYESVILTRAPKHDGKSREVAWDGRTLTEWIACLDGAKAVVNLAGRSVNCRYTPENRRGILDSRVNSVNAIGSAILKCERPPDVWVQAGSLAIYGDAGETLCDEGASFGEGFSVEVCKHWEQAFNSLKTPNTRKVLLRIGFALGRHGGAMEPLVNLAKFFLGGTVGNGKQYISWLHIHDLNRIFMWTIERDDIEGVFNATGPTPVTNVKFMHTLRRVLGRPWSPPVPTWVVRIGARLMGTEPELALTGRRCLPKRLLERGFEFRYVNLEKAFRDILQK